MTRTVLTVVVKLRRNKRLYAYSITSSARASNIGMVKPSASAVLTSKAPIGGRKGDIHLADEGIADE